MVSGFLVREFANSQPQALLCKKESSSLYFYLGTIEPRNKIIKKLDTYSPDSKQIGNCQ